MIWTIVKQVIIMFILAAVGFAMYKGKKISDEGSKAIGNILIFLSLPCVIINGFLVERTTERLQGLWVSALLALGMLLLSMLVSRIILGRRALDNFAGSFSNPGFFGVPLIVASFDDGAVFYIAAFIAFLNLLQWTYGVGLLQRSDENDILQKKEKAESMGKALAAGTVATLKKLVKAPFMIAIVIGLFFFLTGISMPEIPGKCISFIAGVNTPLAMFTIGIYMAQTDLLKMFVKPRLYLVSFVKLLLIPAIAIVIMKFIPVSNEIMKMCILIAAACPVGSNIAVYAQLHKRNHGYAVETVIISTLLSILTIPAMISFANWMW